MALRKMLFEDIVETGENAGNQHFLHFPQYFPPLKNRSYYMGKKECVICKSFGCGQVQDYAVW